MSKFSPKSMLDHLLESSPRDDSNKWSNIGFGEKITQVDLIEVNFTHLIWSPELFYPFSHNTLRCEPFVWKVWMRRFEQMIHTVIYYGLVIWQVTFQGNHAWVYNRSDRGLPQQMRNQLKMCLNDSNNIDQDQLVSGVDSSQEHKSFGLY